MPLNFNPQVLVNLSPTRQVQWPLLQALRLWRTWCPYWSLLHVFLLHVFRTYGSNKQPQHGTLDLIKVSPGLIHLAWFFLSTNSLFALLPISEYLFFLFLSHYAPAFFFLFHRWWARCPSSKCPFSTYSDGNRSVEWTDLSAHNSIQSSGIIQWGQEEG